MNTLEHIRNKFGLTPLNEGGIEIHGVNRTIMAQTLGDLGFSAGAEIGVAEGNHAKVLLNNIPGLRLYCVDAYKHYRGYQEYEDLEKIYSEAYLKLIEYNAVFYKEFSMEAVKKVEDSSLDFVYIDGAHDFVNVAMDIGEWSRKVHPGGVVFGHDFKYHQSFTDRGKYRHPVHVKPVVEAFMTSFDIKPWFVLANDVKDPTFGHDNAGWMFVRSEEDKL